ncbi:hypothetical protein NMG46_25845 [Mesorhizobium sp. LMG 17147]|nr:hypothetical protein [Mesorhizobium sp. LMG 17147]MCP9233603.1 hypothetical protein [Mesorhizobium sp. LMG 17147]
MADIAILETRERVLAGILFNGAAVCCFDARRLDQADTMVSGWGSVSW